jgi:4-amino-4-deoxy-L-arabinose transferase-like glycosyltransferase
MRGTGPMNRATTNEPRPSRAVRQHDFTQQGRVARLLGLLIGAFAVAFYLLWEVAHRGAYDYAQGVYKIDPADEWRYTACSRLVEHGYALFTQVFSAQPPLLFASLAAGMRLFGDSISGARWVEIAFGLLGVICAAWISWLLAGAFAGGLTALLLALSPGYLAYSHTVEAEGPMMALVTLSLALTATYVRKGTKILPALAGLALAAAVLMKLFAAVAILPSAWLIYADRQNWDERRPAMLSLIVAACVPVGLDFGLIHPAQQWDQVIRLHEQAAQLSIAGSLSPFQAIGQFLALDLGLSLLAASGLLALVIRRRWREAVFFCLWALGMVVMLLLFRPLFPHHPAILLTALGCTAGTGIGVATSSMTRPNRPATVVVALGALAYLALVPRLAHSDRHLLTARLHSTADDLAVYVERHSAAGDLIAADDLAVADLAGRLVPPPLCDPSLVRLRSGYLSTRDLITATARYRARLVVPSFGIYRQVPGYMAWLDRHFRRLAGPDGTTIFTRT